MKPCDFVALVMAATLFLACAAKSETTNALLDAEIQGRALAQKILEQRPAENSTNTGLLSCRDAKGTTIVYPIRCETIVTATNWSNIYQLFSPTGLTEVIRTLVVWHDGSALNRYQLSIYAGGERQWTKDGSEVIQRLPFAGDFGGADLGLEFFHWPRQKVVKKEFHRNCPCAVLESTNPDPSAGGYARVDCWIDEDSLGIVEACAYDAQGGKLKNFYPKSLEKVNGRYQVESMVMRISDRLALAAGF